jgi:ATP-dependent DNA helicase RecG
VVTVRQGRYRPYRYRGTAYKRVGAVTAEMGREEYQRLFLEQMHTSDRWEIDPATLGLDDLDQTEVAQTLEDAVTRGRIGDPFSPRPRGRVAWARSGQERADHQRRGSAVRQSGSAVAGLPQCLLKLARFQGVIRGERLFDERQEHGNAFALLRRAEQFCRQHLPIATQLDPDSMIRHDEPEIPLLALREALANAISHREYSSAAGSIGVFIYDDRVEVTSIGPLHFGLSVADLFAPHESQPWNPLIAGTLYRRGVVDSLGSGIQRMIRLVEAAGNPHHTSMTLEPAYGSSSSEAAKRLPSRNEVGIRDEPRARWHWLVPHDHDSNRKHSAGVRLVVGRNTGLLDRGPGRMPTGGGGLGRRAVEVAAGGSDESIHDRQK